MPASFTVPISLIVDVHDTEGGGYWGEVRQLPGCIAQADSLEQLKTSITRAIADWLAEPGVQTEADSRELAAVQGTNEIPPGPYPLRYDYQPPPSWTDADEDE